MLFSRLEKSMTSFRKHWLSDCMRHEMFVHVFYVYFTLKLVVNRKGWSRSMLLFELRRLHSDLSHHIKERQNSIYCLNFLKKKIDIIWKIRLCFLSKVTIYKTGSFKLISTRAVGKTMLYLFSTHAHWTERPIPKMFSPNTSTVTLLNGSVDVHSQ